MSVENGWYEWIIVSIQTNDAYIKQHFQSLFSVNMSHVECMIDIEGIRAIFYIAECSEIGKAYYVAYPCKENQLQDMNLFSLK